MKECKNCGALLEDFAMFCRYCGQSADEQAEMGVQPPHAPEPPNPNYDTEPAQGQDPVYQQTDTQPQTPPADGYYQAPPPGAHASYGPGYQGQPYPPPGAHAPYGPGYQGQPYPPPGAHAPYGPGYQGQPYPPPGAHAPYGQPQYRDVNRIVAGILAILLGIFGIHKFYMGRIGLGIVYLLFFWTCIPAIIGLIEGIIYLCTDEYTFREKYCRRY